MKRIRWGAVSAHAGRYKKKPVVIDAVQIQEPFEVETLEGVMKGKPGDYLVKGVKGEIYPVDQEIFTMTYEVA